VFTDSHGKFKGAALILPQNDIESTYTKKIGKHSHGKFKGALILLQNDVESTYTKKICKNSHGKF
jgi:hypothetical protein